MIFGLNESIRCCESHGSVLTILKLVGQVSRLGPDVLESGLPVVSLLSNVGFSREALTRALLTSLAGWRIVRCFCESICWFSPPSGLGNVGVKKRL